MASQDTLILTCPAKLNWALTVGPLRPDGFHDVVTLMQAIDWTDTLTLTPEPSAEALISLTLSGSAYGLERLAEEARQAPENNLIGRAYTLFKTECQASLPSVSVHLEKNIPMQAGLGGGSSNAAAMLHGLNTLIKSNTPSQALPETTLLMLAGQLGADVAFFMHRYLYPQHPVLLAKGKGEQLTPIEGLDGLPTIPVFVVKPKAVAMATPQAYQWLDEDRKTTTHHTAPLSAPALNSLQALQHWVQHPSNPDALKQWATTLSNDFQAGLCRRQPLMAELEKQLLALGGQPLLAGSGSAMALPVVSPATFPEQPASLFPAAAFETRLCQTLTKS